MEYSVNSNVPEFRKPEQHEPAELVLSDAIRLRLSASLSESKVEVPGLASSGPSPLNTSNSDSSFSDSMEEDASDLPFLSRVSSAASAGSDWDPLDVPSTETSPVMSRCRRASTDIETLEQDAQATPAKLKRVVDRSTSMELVRETPAARATPAPENPAPTPAPTDVAVVAPAPQAAPALAAAAAPQAKGNAEYGVVKHTAASAFQSYHLLYPKSWRAGNTHSLFAKQGERECIDWLMGRGLITSDAMRQALLAVQVYHYTGGVMPYCNYPQMVNFSKFAVFWTLWDDVEVEVSSNAKVQDVINAIRGIPVTGDPDNIHTKYAKAFEELAHEWRHKFNSSETYMERLASGFQLWCEKAIEEARIFRDKSAFTEYSFDYIEDMRSITAGCRLGVTFVEMYAGFELDPAVVAHPNYQRMQIICGSLVRYVNDLVSIANDMTDDDAECRWENLIWIDLYQQRAKGNAGYTVQDAIKRIMDMHDSVIAEFERLAASAAEWVPKHVDLESTQSIFSLMRYYTYGANACQAIIPRYNRNRCWDVSKKVAYMWTLGTEPRP